MAQIRLAGLLHLKQKQLIGATIAEIAEKVDPADRPFVTETADSLSPYKSSGKHFSSPQFSSPFSAGPDNALNRTLSSTSSKSTQDIVNHYSIVAKFLEDFSTADCGGAGGHGLQQFGERNNDRITDPEIFSPQKRLRLFDDPEKAPEGP